VLAGGRSGGLASSDAHGHVKVGRRSVRVPDYPDSFRMVQTHLVLKEPLSGEDSTDRDTILDALRRGACRPWPRVPLHLPTGRGRRRAGGARAVGGERAGRAHGERVCGFGGKDEVASPGLNQYGGGTLGRRAETVDAIARELKIPVAYLFADGERLARMILAFAQLPIAEQERLVRDAEAQGRNR